MKAVIISAIAALSLTAQAAIPSFKNAGTLDGWDKVYIDSGSKGTVTQVTNVLFPNTTSAIKATQTYTNYGGRYHSEVHKNYGYKKGDTGFYSFAFRLSETWQFDPVQSYNIAQFIAAFNNDCDDSKPSTMFWLEGTKLQTRLQTGNVGSNGLSCTANNSGMTKKIADIATVSAGVWHTVIIQANWQSTATGSFKVWFDGNKVVDKSDVITTVGDTATFGYHVGLYANGWHDDDTMKGSQPFRQIWYSKIATGNSYAEVDPNTQW